MSLNLEGLRKACARRLYEDTLKTETGVSWFALAKPLQEGYEMMAGAIFDELFKKPHHELYEFFYGSAFDLDDLALADGYIRPETIRNWGPSDLDQNVSDEALHLWAAQEGYSR